MFQGLFIFAAYCRTCLKTYTDIDRGDHPEEMSCPSCGARLPWVKEIPLYEDALERVVITEAKA